mmetsp:Transcript_11363/g.34434  ORF Transcript_11363/g.34434 Transcript_11363/m.34434 type:complete len:377 (-) Transcript_11363:1145-2275(-)
MKRSLASHGGAPLKQRHSPLVNLARQPSQTSNPGLDFRNQVHNQAHGISQLIGSPPPCSRKALAWEKHLLPMKAGHVFVGLVAESGDGCDVLMMWCRATSMRLALVCAGLPQRRKTTPSRSSLTFRMTASVKDSQPRLWCELALALRTVRQVLSSSTPCDAQCSRFPWFGVRAPVSARSSLNMLRRDGGFWMLPSTLKDSPCACPGWWYGSWPRITTLVSWSGQRRSALNTFSRGGKIVRLWYSAARKLMRSRKYFLDVSSSRAARHAGSTPSRLTSSAPPPAAGAEAAVVRGIGETLASTSPATSLVVSTLGAATEAAFLLVLLFFLPFCLAMRKGLSFLTGSFGRSMCFSGAKVRRWMGQGPCLWMAAMCPAVG